MATIPANIIFFWPSTAASIPAGWSRETSLDALFGKGVATAATNPGTTGGATTHTHAMAAGHVHDLTHGHTSSGSSGVGTGTVNDSSVAGTSGATVAHTHTKSSLQNSAAFNSGSTTPGTSGTASNDPANLEVIYIKSDGTPTGVPDSALGLFNSDTLPSSWSRYNNGKNRFLKGAAAAGDGGTTNAGNVSHTHTVAAHTHTGTSHGHTSDASGGGSASAGQRTTGSVTPPTTHTHTPTVSAATSGALDNLAGDTSASQNNEPPYYKQNIIQNGVGAADLPTNIIGAWIGTIAAIPSEWIICDGNNSTPNLLGQYIKGCNADGELGNTGGSASAHGHSGGSGHTHTVATHNHALNDVATATLTLTSASSGVNFANATHTHSWGNSDNDSTTSGSTSAGSMSNNAATNEPPFYEVAYLQYQPGGVATTVKPRMLTMGVGM